MSSFYVTLPSDSSFKYFPTNKLTNYVTKLPQPIDLKGDWEVGLYEIQFPTTWYNITEEMAVLKYTSFGSNALMHAIISPPAGHYDDPAELMDMINGAIATVEREASCRFHYNSISKKVSIDFLGPMPVTLSMKKEFAELLGFDWLKKPKEDEEYYTNLAIDTKEGFMEDVFGMLEFNASGKYPYKGDKVCDLQRGFYSLYVYSDAVQPKIVGDAKVPLLRTVNVNEESWRMVTRIYETIQYSPVQRKHFDVIEVDIRDSVGRKVPFQTGQVIVMLHFRLKKPSYF